MHPVNFTLELRQTEEGLLYQHLAYQLDNDNLPTHCLKNLQLPAELTQNCGVVIEGKGPNWLYSYLTTQLRSLPWIGCYALGTGAVVVASQVKEIPGGTVFLIPSLLVS